MSTASLLEAIGFTRDPKPLVLKRNLVFPAQIPARQPFTTRTLSAKRKTLKINPKAAKFYVEGSTKSEKKNDSESENKVNKPSLIEKVVDTIIISIKALQKPAAAAVVLVVLLYCYPHSSLAASGGRVGGRSFSSSRSSSSSSSSRRSSSSSHYWSRRRLDESPPWITPFGFTRGKKKQKRLFFGPKAYWTTNSNTTTPLPYSCTVSVIVPPVTPIGPTNYHGILDRFGLLVCFSGVVIAIVIQWDDLTNIPPNATGVTTPPKASVVKLQVGLLGVTRSLQTDLDNMALTADTSTPQGFTYVLTVTSLALLRHDDCHISGYLSVDVKQSVEDCEQLFNQLSIEERANFDEETLVNVDNVKRQSTRSQGADALSNMYIVV